MPFFGAGGNTKLLCQNETKDSSTPDVEKRLVLFMHGMYNYLQKSIHGLRDGSLQNQFLPGRFLRDCLLKISNGTVRSKVVGRFAPKQIYGSIHPFL